MIKHDIFGELPDGRDVIQYTIENANGEQVKILNFGASVHSIMIRERDQHLHDVTLGAQDASHLLQPLNFEGAFIGRYANRISGAAYAINGQTYYLQPVHDGCCLHSGYGNYGSKIFEAQVVSNNGIRFSYLDAGEGGFNGRVLSAVQYTWTDDSRLKIEYELVPEETTITAPTNHTFFSLDDGDIRDNVLQIDSDRYVVTDENQLPTGELKDVTGTVFDFRNEIKIRNAMMRRGQSRVKDRGYDDCLMLNGDGFRRVASLKSLKSGVELVVSTDMPSIVLFTFGAPLEFIGKNNQIYQGFRSVCLETGFPINAVNCPSFDPPITQGGEKFCSTTEYSFKCLM